MTLKPWPTSIFEINSLKEEDKRAIYGTLLPSWLFKEFGIDPETLSINGIPVVRFRCPQGSRVLEITVCRNLEEPDPLLYLNMADTFNNQLLVLLVVVNDLDSPRFDTDIGPDGRPTQFGTLNRNLEAEEAAMKAGLAPGQIRPGLRVFRRSIPIFEQFVTNMGHDLFLIEPLAYHNAITFERYGFNYIKGHQEMVKINQGFQPGGYLYQQLTPDNPFRQPDAWKTVRGRSWAIHDGILGHPFTGFQMYKRIGVNAEINTFPNARW